MYFVPTIRFSNKYLIATGADVNSTNNDGYTALHGAIVTNEVEKLRLLVSAGARANSKGDDGNTALHLAAECWTVEPLKYLLGAGADISLTSNEGKTVIHKALTIDYPATVANETYPEGLPFLLDSGACVGFLPALGFWLADKLLVKSGVDMDIREPRLGKTALHFAGEQNQKGFVRLITGKTALHYDAAQGLTK